MVEFNEDIAKARIVEFLRKEKEEFRKPSRFITLARVCVGDPLEYEINPDHWNEVTLELLEELEEEGIVFNTFGFLGDDDIIKTGRWDFVE